MRERALVLGAALGAAVLAWSCSAVPSDPAAAPVQPLVEEEASAPSDLAQLELEPRMRPPRELDQDGVVYVETEDPKLPLVRYRDGQLALSDSCAVLLGNKLNRKIPPAYVNGQAIGFC